MDADNFFLNHDIVMVAFCTVLGNGKRGDNLKIGPGVYFRWDDDGEVVL